MLVKKKKKKETSLGNLELPQQVFQGRNKRKEARTQAHKFRFYRQIKEIGKHTIDKRGTPTKRMKRSVLHHPSFLFCFRWRGAWLAMYVPCALLVQLEI